MCPVRKKFKCGTILFQPVAILKYKIFHFKFYVDDVLPVRNGRNGKISTNGPIFQHNFRTKVFVT